MRDRLDILRVRSVPFMARGNYFAEALHMLPWGVVAGMAEGGITAVVAAKTFGGGPLLISVAFATPMVAKLVSLMWGMYSVGRKKLRLVTLLAVGLTITFATVVATPQTPYGGWLFVAQIAAVQVCIYGVVTVRTALWRINYPSRYRGRITAKLQIMRFVGGMVATFAAAVVFQTDASWYRWAYLAVAGCGAASIVLLRGMRVRGERGEMRRMEADTEAGLDEGLAEPFSVAAVLHPGNVAREMARVLREDRRFARYCAALMLLGTGNLMAMPVLAKIFVDDMALGYVGCFLLIHIIPHTIMLGSLFRWAKFYDRVGVVRFRVINGGCWFLFQLFSLLAGLSIVFADTLGPAAGAIALVLFSFSAVGRGLGLGGGELAWNLGHLHFAREHEAELYMGVHVTLTGMRGVVAPFVGIWLWSHWGMGLWAVTCALSFAGLMGYVLMARDERRPPDYNPKRERHAVQSAEQTSAGRSGLVRPIAESEPATCPRKPSPNV